jgi:hypothetical protein
VNAALGLLLAVLTSTIPSPGNNVDAAPNTIREKLPIFVQADTTDAIGAAYVARLRDALRGSPAYRDAAGPSDARFIVGIITMDPNEAEPTGRGRSTVAAITLRRDGSAGSSEFIYSWVLVAKRDTVDSLVAELFAAIDREIQDLENVPLVLWDDVPQSGR